jgi:hypothetical protein
LPLGYSFHDLSKFLKDQGYKLVISEWYPIRVYGGLHDWKRFTIYPCELGDLNAWGNILEAREDDLYQSLRPACNLSG